MKQVLYFNYPIGELGIVQQEGFITNISFGAFGGEADVCSTPLLERAAKCLRAYFDGELKEFDLPIRPEGTAFRLKVWEELQKIPYGQTISYGQLAKNIQSPSSSRAVGGANNKNPIPIIIPCHRVIGAKGQLVGYAGGMQAKQLLLNLEQGL